MGKLHDHWRCIVALYVVGLYVNRIIPKIEEYREFFAAFHEIMLQLMLVLG